AVPALGYLFVAWSGDTTATTDSLDLVMRVDKSVTATFRVDLAVAPSIASVTDVPLDQGGFVQLRWRPSVFEFVPQDSGIAATHYFIWREAPLATPEASLAASTTHPAATRPPLLRTTVG